MSGNLEIGLESDTQVGIDNISFNIKTTYYRTISNPITSKMVPMHSQTSKT